MQNRELRLPTRRRAHLGLLRTELSGRSYEPFFRWELDALPDSVEEALAHGPADPDSALPRADAARLLEAGYLPLETGYAEMPDGSVFVSALTQFPGASSEMIDWWFGWHGAETDRYKLWHPQAHLFTQWRFERSDDDGRTDREKYVGNTSYVDEYVGPHIHRLAIQFREPGEFGLDVDAFPAAGVGTAVCARTGLNNRPADAGYLLHLIRETAEGCEMRSRFWVGEAHVRFLPQNNPIDRLLATRFARRRLLPRGMGRDLLIHCAEEMNHLASFLPELYAQETAGR